MSSWVLYPTVTFGPLTPSQLCSWEPQDILGHKSQVEASGGVSSCESSYISISADKVSFCLCKCEQLFCARSEVEKKSKIMVLESQAVMTSGTAPPQQIGASWNCLLMGKYT